MNSGFLLVGLGFFLFAFAHAEVEVKIDEGRFLREEAPFFVTEASVGAWVTQVKSFVNNSMLNPDGAMSQLLLKQGDLSDRQRHLLSYYVEVKPLAGTHNVYLALFYSRLHMNKTLIRASLYQDGGPGVQKLEVPTGRELFFHESMEAARGLNLRGSTILSMIKDAKTLGVTLSQEEMFFSKRILQPLADWHSPRNEDFFIIAFNVVGFSLDTLGHEIAHSLFDTNAEYKKVIKDFWKNSVLEKDKKKIREILSDIYSSEDVIIDEFQAYILQPKVPAAQSEILASFVPRYMRPLIVALEEKSLPLPVVGENCSLLLAE